MLYAFPALPFLPGCLLPGNPRVFTTTQASFKPSNGCRVFLVEVIGGGGGGAGATGPTNGNVAGGSGGGAGSYGWRFITNQNNGTAVGTVYSITIGAAGGGGTGAGSNGGSTTFDDGVNFTLTGNGGTGGATQAAGTTLVWKAGGAGGVIATGGNFHATGEPGHAFKRITGNQGYAGRGGCTMWGACGKAGSVEVGNQDAAGAAGAGPGAGGTGGISGSSNDAAGAAGIKGACRIWEFA